MRLTCPTFENGGSIPERYIWDGNNLSPPLEWSDVPKGSKEFVLFLEDPDAPRGPGKDHPFVHWIAYNISAATSFLPEGLPEDERILAPVIVDQGKNSFRRIGYRGPKPVEGKGLHHYRFTLFALSSRLNVPPGAGRGELLFAMKGKVLAQAVLTGTYERALVGRAA